MEYTVFAAMFDRVDLALANYVTTNSQNLIAFLLPIFESCMVIYLAIWGYMTMYGRSGELLTESFYRMVRITAIITLGLTVGTYSDVVVNFFSKAPEAVASAMIGSESDSVTASLDSLLTTIINIGMTAWEKGGIMNGNFGMYVIAGIILGFGCVLTAIVAFFLLLSKIMLSLLLAVGPLFIMMLLFNSTQRFFESWLGMVVNHGMILILAAGLGQLLINVGDYYLGKVDDFDPDMIDAAMLAINYGLLILVLKQIPTMASVLGGGIALATQGAIGNAMKGMGKAGSAATKVSPKNIRNNVNAAKKSLQENLNATRQGAATVGKYTGVNAAGRAAKAAYQKRFGGNSVNQS